MKMVTKHINALTFAKIWF